MVGMLALTAVDHGLGPVLVKPKTIKFGICCCFSAKHITLRRKSKDWLVRIRIMCLEWGDMSIRGLLFQWQTCLVLEFSFWEILLFLQGDCGVPSGRFSLYVHALSKILKTEELPVYICKENITKFYFWGLQSVIFFVQSCSREINQR